MPVGVCARLLKVFERVRRGWSVLLSIHVHAGGVHDHAATEVRRDVGQVVVVPVEKLPLALDVLSADTEGYPDGRELRRQRTLRDRREARPFAGLKRSCTAARLTPSSSPMSCHV